MNNSNNFISEKTAVPYILGFIFFLIFGIAFFSDSCFDAGDGLQHYIMARYSWLHPYLLMDSWGKPFYTLISSPFAQFGLNGSILFNIMCGIGSAFFAYKLSKKLALENAWIVIPFVLFTPGYFPTLNSGLTEPFFSFIVVASAYGFMCKKYSISCILISFLPFVRTEGFFILPLFLIVLLYRRRFFEILLLGLGTLVYSLIGKFFSNDFFWIVNQNPYNGSNKEIYGHGEITHFIANHNYLLGTTLLIFFLAGIVGFFMKILSIKRSKTLLKDTFLAEEFILIMGSFGIYLVAHSIMWWKGWANSLGMLRVMAGVLPCASILCLRGFNVLLFDKIRKVPVLKNSIIAIVLALVVITPFKKEYFPFKLSPEQRVIKEASNWFNSTTLKKQKLFYLTPYLTYLLNVDSSNPNKVNELWGLYPSIEKNGIEVIPDSSIVFWDSHFGPNECHIPLSKLIQDKNFKLIKSFVPEQRFTTLGGHAFELHVFKKVSEVQAIGTLKSVIYNFETPLSSLPAGELDSTISFSGNKCLKIINSNEFSTSFSLPLAEIPPNTLLCKMQARIFNPNTDSLKIISVIYFNDHNNNNLMYDGKDIAIKQSATDKDWYLVESTCNLLPSSYASKSNKFGFYLWNLNHKTFYIDDIKFHFIGKK